MWFTHASMRTTEHGAHTGLLLTHGHDGLPHQRGISLVELMIGMTIGMIALLVMVQTFSASSGHKANTVSGADATTAGHIALTLIERDLLNAGAAMNMTQCKSIKFIDQGSGLPSSFSGMPVIITPEADTPTAFSARSDRISIRYAESAEAMVGNTTLTESMPSPSSTLFASTAMGFAEGDLVMLHDPAGNCAIQRLTQDPGKSGRSGGSWRFQINPADPYNDPGDSAELFPPGGYVAGSGKIMSLGPLGIIETDYYMGFRSSDADLPSADLVRTERNMAAAGAPSTLTRDVVALRAQYGWWNSGTNSVSFSSAAPAGAEPQDLAAVRVGIVVRGSQRDRSYTAPSSIKLFEFDNPITITLAGDELNYRYRTFETVVPLRNTIWNR